MTDIDPAVIIPDQDKSWDLLASQRLGRLALMGQSGVDIYPVNYVVDGESIVFRSASGSKLSQISTSGLVSFEADSWDETSGFSVIAKGTAEVVSDPGEIAQVEALRLKPWTQTVKTIFVRIRVDSISARRFYFGPDPIERYR